MGVDLGGDGGDIYPPLFRQGGMINVVIPPTFLCRKFTYLIKFKFEANITLNEHFFFWLHMKLGENLYTFLKMTYYCDIFINLHCERRQGQQKKALSPDILQKESVKPFLGRQIWHKLLKIHFGVSENCCPEPDHACCKSFDR